MEVELWKSRHGGHRWRMLCLEGRQCFLGEHGQTFGRGQDTNCTANVPLGRLAFLLPRQSCIIDLVMLSGVFGLVVAFVLPRAKISSFS